MRRGSQPIEIAPCGAEQAPPHANLHSLRVLSLPPSEIPSSTIRFDTKKYRGRSRGVRTVSLHHHHRSNTNAESTKSYAHGAAHSLPVAQILPRRRPRTSHARHAALA